MTQDISPRSARLRILLFLAAAISILAAFYLLSSVSNTLNTLTVVEAERDQWQRPAEVLRSLGIGEGSRVVDLGSGAGYFTLKLADLTGKRGKVLAVDLRRMSLFFLRLRTWLRHVHNIEIIVGTPDDPHLPAGRADAVLISNTYHEFTNPRLMLDRVWVALHPGGRLVIVDRGPRASAGQTDSGAAPGHEIPPASVEQQLREKGFEILSRNDGFIDRPGDEPWWLITAGRP